ncbi:unnamed protein product, partial [Prorocentrum cordatum]
MMSTLPSADDTPPSVQPAAAQNALQSLFSKQRQKQSLGGASAGSQRPEAGGCGPASVDQTAGQPDGNPGARAEGEIAELLASQEQPTCILRKEIYDPLAKGVRITHNGTMITCANCRVRDQTLRRIFGGWPIAEFDELSNGGQDDFYKECGCTAAACRDAMKHMLMQVRMKRITETRSGQYLPLSVHEKLGYNTDDIEQKTAAADIEDHPVLGKTYRVAINSISEARIKEVIMQEVAKTVGHNRKRK